jgi:hypothetical protein
MKTKIFAIATTALVLICDPASAQTRGVGAMVCRHWHKDWNAQAKTQTQSAATPSLPSPETHPHPTVPPATKHPGGTMGR